MKFLVKKIEVIDEYTGHTLNMDLNIEVEIDKNEYISERDYKATTYALETLLEQELYKNSKVIKKIENKFYKIFAKDNEYEIKVIAYKELTNSVQNIDIKLAREWGEKRVKNKIFSITESVKNVLDELLENKDHYFGNATLEKYSYTKYIVEEIERELNKKLNE